MDEERFNMNIRKFLKKVGVTSQRAIEDVVRTALEKQKLHGEETLSVAMTLRIAEVDLEVTIDGTIALA